MQVVVDNLLITYNQVGNGKLLLVLHGWGDSSRSFVELQEQLAKHYCVVAVDLPGFGASQAPATVWDLDDYALFLRSFLKKVHASSLEAIIGHSNGGSVAIIGLTHARLFSHKLVLIGSAGIRDRQKTRRLLLKVIAKTGKSATFWLPAKKRQKLRKRLYGAARSDMLVAPHMEGTFKKTVRQDIQTDASRLTTPTLLIYGQNDKATPPLYGEIYNRLIKGSQLEIISNAGHFVHHDQLAQTVKLIEEFLS